MTVQAGHPFSSQEGKMLRVSSRVHSVSFVVSALMGVVLALPPAGASAAETKGEGPGTPAWSARMQSMKASLETLLGDLLKTTGKTESSSAVKKREERIQKEADSIAKAAHSIRVQKNLDPGLAILAGNLEADVTHGAAMWKAGHVDYARGVLLQSTSLCMGCHTRTYGQQFPASEEPVQGADDATRAVYFAAVRDFDRSMAAINRVIDNPEIRQNRTTEWERAVRQGLQIAVRAKQDPKEAVRLLDHVLALKDLPIFFREDVTKWRAQLVAWEKERSRIPMTEEGLWSEVLRVSEEAGKVRKYPADRSAEVLTLRLSAVLHQFLERFPKSRHEAEALFLQGMAYDSLRPAALWNASESFWTACIRTSPHSSIARRCYRSLEDAVLAGWMGSVGVEVPADVRNRLAELGDLAAPASVGGAPKGSAAP